MQVGLTATARREIPIPPLSRSDIAYHAVGVTINATLTVWGAVWLVTHWSSLAPHPLILAVVIAIGWFLSDFVSGLLHWTFDTWFREDSPFVGRMVLIVREHHVYPQHIFRYRFYYEAGSVSWASIAHTLPVIGTVTLLLDKPASVGFSVVLISTMVSVFTLFMLQFHKLGHRKTDSRVLSRLQKMHLLMSLRHHAQHHRNNHDTKYCLINGWADWVCDHTGFWRAAERVLSRLTGAVPRSNDNEWMRRYRGRPAAATQPAGAPVSYAPPDKTEEETLQ